MFKIILMSETMKAHEGISILCLHVKTGHQQRENKDMTFLRLAIIENNISCDLTAFMLIVKSFRHMTHTYHVTMLIGLLLLTNGNTFEILEFFKRST